MLWVILVLIVASSGALVVWRRQAEYFQELYFGNRVPPGCALVEGVLLLLFALTIYLAYRAGLLTSSGHFR
jgi:hypothetical protein